MEPEPLKTFLEARDFLIQHRTDYSAAYQGFHWPQLTHFNWALGLLRRHGAPATTQPALWVVDEERRRDEAAPSPRCPSAPTGSPTSCAPSASSAATASCSCSATRCRCGRSCWPPSSSASVVIPATTLLTRRRPGRPPRARARPARHCRRGPRRRNSTTLAGQLLAHQSSAAALPAGRDFEKALPACGRLHRPTAPTRVDDPLLLYFTSGTTTKPKLVLHTQHSYPVGPPVDDVLARACSPATCTSTSARPGWAKHAWSCFFAPWNAGA